MKTLLVTGVTVAAIGLFLLATASADTTLFGKHYPLLLAINAVLAVLFGALVVYQLAGVVRRYRVRVFGSRLTVRLLVRFALLAVVPGVLVYTVSVQFLTRSIETWFDVKVDAALEGGIRLGQQAIDQMLGELQVKGRAMALELADRQPGLQVTLLNRLREQAGVQEAVIVSASGRLLASATDDVSRLVPELPSQQALRQSRGNTGYTAIDTTPGKPLALRVVLPINALSLTSEARFLQLRQTVPSSFSRNAEAVEIAYRDYRELALSRDGLKRIYIGTLTFALLLALFAAVAVAATQSNLLAEPLANLAQATQAVARGDFSRRPPVTSSDELGVLTESFNSMTGQLEEARVVVETNRVELETAKSHLESILANLSAGVLVFDDELQLSISNHGAAAILGGALITMSGKPLETWHAGLEQFAEPVRDAFVTYGHEKWQREIDLKGTGKTLLARGAGLPMSSGGGYVLVFDEITQLIQAQRATAWAEVARRLAHEIKNPLTPIQLSAERLEFKLADKLAKDDAEMLRRGIHTIVSQVSAMKAMVDDFREYARLPAPVFAPLDLNLLVADILSLYEGSGSAIEKNLSEELAPAWADAKQVRQVLHNLVQNAQDALETRRSRGELAQLAVRTAPSGEWIRLTVSDNGDGFPEEMMHRVFEPYATTKSRGTGLGLAIVKKIMDEHHGSISIENRPHHGASVHVMLPVASTTNIVIKAA